MKSGEEWRLSEEGRAAKHLKVTVVSALLCFKAGVLVDALWEALMEDHFVCKEEELYSAQAGMNLLHLAQFLHFTEEEKGAHMMGKGISQGHGQVSF